MECPRPIGQVPISCFCNVRRLSVQVPPGHDVGMSQGQLWFLFRSVAIAPPMDISGSKQQAFLLLPHSSPPNLVQIRVVGVNDTDRPTDKAYSMSALALAKICRPTFMRLCWHVSETHQGKRHALYPRVTSTKKKCKRCLFYFSYDWEMK